MLRRLCIKPLCESIPQNPAVCICWNALCEKWHSYFLEVLWGLSFGCILRADTHCNRSASQAGRL